MDTNKLGVVEFLDKYEVVCGDEDVVAFLDKGFLGCLDNNNNNKDSFMYIFSMNTHWDSFLSKYYVVND